MIEQNKKILKTKLLTTPVRIAFNLEKMTLLLNIINTPFGIELKKTEAEKFGLTEKDDFHFTIISERIGSEILKYFEKLDETEKSDKLDKIHKLVESTEWKVILKDKFFYIQKDYSDLGLNDSEITIPEKRASIIQMAEIDGLDDFYRKLNLLLDAQIETPLPHVTLFTTSTKVDKKLRGIGISSKKQFNELKPERI